jgi:hypothetical protein
MTIAILIQRRADRLQERMNSPLETRKVRLRGLRRLTGRATEVPGTPLQTQRACHPEAQSHCAIRLR